VRKEGRSKGKNKRKGREGRREGRREGWREVPTLKCAICNLSDPRARELELVDVEGALALGRVHIDLDVEDGRHLIAEEGQGADLAAGGGGSEENQV